MNEIISLILTASVWVVTLTFILIVGYCVIMIPYAKYSNWSYERRKKKLVESVDGYIPFPVCYFCKNKFVHAGHPRLEKDDKLACLPCAQKHGWYMPFKEGFLIEKEVVFAKCSEELHPGDFVLVDTRGKSIPEWTREMQQQGDIPPTESISGGNADDFPQMRHHDAPIAPVKMMAEEPRLCMPPKDKKGKKKCK